MRDRIKKLPAIGSDVKQPNRITISNIAELAGVSKATASLVLNGKGDEYRVGRCSNEYWRLLKNIATNPVSMPGRYAVTQPHDWFGAPLLNPVHQRQSGERAGIAVSECRYSDHHRLFR